MSEWIKIIEFSIDKTLHINKYYFLHDAGETLTVGGEDIPIAPKVAMYKGGGKFIGDYLEVLLIEDFTHIMLFEPPKD